MSTLRKQENRRITDELESSKEELKRLQEDEADLRDKVKRRKGNIAVQRERFDLLVTKIRAKIENGQPVLDDPKREEQEEEAYEYRDSATEGFIRKDL